MAQRARLPRRGGALGSHRGGGGGSAGRRAHDPGPGRGARRAIRPGQGGDAARGPRARRAGRTRGGGDARRMIQSVRSRPAMRARRVGDTRYEIGADPERGMRVPAQVYADDVLWEQISSDRSTDQLVTVATLPGVVRGVYAMPDAHEGSGFPVGGVAAFRLSDGIVSPGGVGYDINCGVRLLASDLSASELGDRLEPLVHELSRRIPSGVGRGGRVALTDDELDRVFVEGCGYLLEQGSALPDDLAHTESEGRMPGAEPSAVSARARDRGRGQLGTMGAGNHFVEVERVSGIFDPGAASALGLEMDRVALLVHTGSRGLGHQVCTDWVARMDRAMAEYGIELPDRQL